MHDRAQSVVALGGGHGLHASLSALRQLVDDLTVDELTAIVTVADNGGSSGRLREQFDVLPPGDLRMALAALCGAGEWGQTWARVMQHRFAGDGDMRGHNLGNLLFVGLWELLGDNELALDWLARLLGAKGRVLPMALVPMDITARVRRPGGEVATVTGQVEVATTEGVIEQVALVPEDPPASSEALAAITEADWVFLGPGSWFTSVIPHLLVPALRESLLATRARLVVVLNLAEQAGETPGFGPADHLDVLFEHARGLQVDTVLADRTMDGLDELAEAAEAYGARLVLADIAVADGSARHDPELLASAYREILVSTRTAGRSAVDEGR